MNETTSVPDRGDEKAQNKADESRGQYKGSGESVISSLNTGINSGSCNLLTGETVPGEPGHEPARSGNSDGRTLLFGTLAKAVSAIMHPFLMPVYAMLLLLSGDPIFGMSPLRDKLFFISVIAINALVIPAFSIAMLRVTGYISDLSLDKRQDRTIPIAVVALCYGICIYMVSDIFFGLLIKRYLIAAFACALSALAVTFFWKISLHLIAAGGVTGMLVILAAAGYNPVFIPLIVMFIMSGVLAAARLYLGKHTPAQVYAGFALGFCVSFLSIFIFF